MITVSPCWILSDLSDHAIVKMAQPKEKMGCAMQYSLCNNKSMLSLDNLADGGRFRGTDVMPYNVKHRIELRRSQTDVAT